jgi:hypothetical protein
MFPGGRKPVLASPVPQLSPHIPSYVSPNFAFIGTLMSDLELLIMLPIRMNHPVLSVPTL